MKIKFLLFIMSVFIVTGCWSESNSAMNNSTNNANNTEGSNMKIKIASKDYEIIYELYDNQAAKDLYEQLPLNLLVQDFSTNEKTFYPPKKLNTNGANESINATKGSLCYYSPWADVVLFYAHHGRGNQLYDIGKCIFGIENIEKLNGNIIVSIAE